MGDFFANLKKDLAGGKKALYEDKNKPGKSPPSSVKTGRDGSGSSPSHVASTGSKGEMPREVERQPASLGGKNQGDQPDAKTTSFIFKSGQNKTTTDHVGAGSEAGDGDADNHQPSGPPPPPGRQISAAEMCGLIGQVLPTADKWTQGRAMSFIKTMARKERQQQERQMRDPATDDQTKKVRAMVWAVREMCAHDQLVPPDQRKSVRLKEDCSLLSQLRTPGHLDPSFMDGLLFRHALQACVVHGAAGSLEVLLRETLVKPTDKDKKKLRVGEVRAKMGSKVLKWSHMSLDALDSSWMYLDEPLNAVTEDYVRAPLPVQAAIADAPAQIMQLLVEYNVDINEMGLVALAPQTKDKMVTSPLGAAAFVHSPETLDFLLRQPHADPSVLSEGGPLAGLNLLQLACGALHEPPPSSQDDAAPKPPLQPKASSRKSRKKAASKGKCDDSQVQEGQQEGKLVDNGGIVQGGEQQEAGGSGDTFDAAAQESKGGAAWLIGEGFKLTLARVKELAQEKETARQSSAVAVLEALEHHGLTRSAPGKGKGGRSKGLHCRTMAGNTLLHLAAINGWSRVVDWLLAKGVDAEAVNTEGLTALDEARRNGWKSCVDLLVAHLESRRKAVAAELLHEERMAREKEERAARKREQKRLKRLSATGQQGGATADTPAADEEVEMDDGPQHEGRGVGDVTEEAATPSCPPDAHDDSVEPALSDQPSDHQQQHALSHEPPDDIGRSPIPSTALPPAHIASTSHLLADPYYQPPSSSSSFVDPPVPSTVSTTPADRPSTAQPSARPDDFPPADGMAQLRAELNDAIDKKESLEAQYGDVLEARRRATERVKELKTKIRRLRYVTPNLSQDVLASLATAAEVRGFEAKINREEERLDELLVAACQHATQLQSGALKAKRAPAAEQQSAPAAAAPSSADGCGLPVCHEMSVLLNESSTEEQLIEATEHIRCDIDQLECDISRMTEDHIKAEAALQTLEQEHHTLQQEANKRLTPTRLESLTSIAAVDAFRRDIKKAKQELRDLARDAAVRHAALEKEETDAAAAASGDGGEGTCVMCISERPIVVFFPCLQKCLCEGCWREMAAAHDTAKREKARLEALERRVPDSIARDAQLKCPMCNQEAHYASTVDGIRTAT